MSSSSSSSSARWWSELTPNTIAHLRFEDFKDALETGYDVNTLHPHNGLTILHILFSQEINMEKIFYVLNTKKPNISIGGAKFNRTIFYAFTAWRDVDWIMARNVIRKLCIMDEYGTIIRHMDKRGMTAIDYLQSVISNNIRRDGETLYVIFLRQVIDELKQHIKKTSPLFGLNSSFMDDDLIVDQEPCSSSSTSVYFASTSTNKKRMQRV